MHQQALRRRLVLGEIPEAPEIRKEGGEPTLRSGRSIMRPALFAHLGRIAHRDCPGAGRVHDQRTLAGDQPFVVAGVVPCPDVGRQARHDLLEPIQHLARGVRLDRDLSLRVDKLGTIRVEHGADPIDRIRWSLAQGHSKWIATLGAFLRRIQEGIPGPFGREFLVSRRARWIHGHDIDAGELLHQVDARAWRLDLAAGQGRHDEPVACLLAEIFDPGSTAPFAATNSFMMSSIGSRSSE